MHIRRWGACISPLVIAEMEEVAEVHVTRGDSRVCRLASIFASFGQIWKVMDAWKGRFDVTALYPTTEDSRNPGK